MLKKFFEGIVLGLGMAISFVVVWVIGIYFVFPHLLASYTTPIREARFEHPSDAVVKQEEPKLASEQKEFNLFKPPPQMAIPAGGGILSVSPTTTAKGSKRPSTYQLWLTETKLWQIRTVEEKVEIEELPYPKDTGVSTLDDLMFKNVGMASRHSTMTVSPEKISGIRAAASSSLDERLNGSLKMSVEGAVFILPNPYDT